MSPQQTGIGTADIRTREAGGAFPGAMGTQWLHCRRLFADRCGGSAGIASIGSIGRTGFPFNVLFE